MDHNRFPPPEIQVARIARDIFEAIGRPLIKEDHVITDSPLWNTVLEEIESLDANSLMLVICMANGKDLLEVFPGIPISEDEIGERLIERIAATAILAKIIEIYG